MSFLEGDEVRSQVLVETNYSGKASLKRLYLKSVSLSQLFEEWGKSFQTEETVSSKVTDKTKFTFTAEKEG